MAFVLCRGRGPERGKYRGVIASEGNLSGEGKSVFWSKETIEVALPESAFLECQQDPEIVIVKIRDLTATEAAAHVQGPVAAQAVIDLGVASIDAIRAELARREQAEAQAAEAQAKADAEATAAASAQKARANAKADRGG